MPTFFTSVKNSCTKITDFISRLLGLTFKNTKTRAIYGAEIRDMTLKCYRKNKVATLAGGDFVASYEGPTSGSRIVTPAESIANWFSASSTSIGSVDNYTKPPEGIEPSENRVTILLPHPADGVLSIYHDIVDEFSAVTLFVWTRDLIEINRWGCPFYADVCTSSQQRESWEVLSLTPIERPPYIV